MRAFLARSAAANGISSSDASATMELKNRYCVTSSSSCLDSSSLLGTQSGVVTLHLLTLLESATVRSQLWKITQVSELLASPLSVIT